MTYDMPRFSGDVTYKPSIFSSASKTNAKYSTGKFRIMEDQSQDVEEKAPIVLGTEVKNSIRHTFEALQQNGNGKTHAAQGEVSKLKLQLLCANISQDLGIVYTADDLENFKADKKGLTCGEFVDYIEDELLPKGNHTDLQKEHKVFWTIVSQTFFKKQEHLLSEDQAYKQWLLFNILDIDETSRVHKQELGLILERICNGIGKVWDPTPLNASCDLEELTFWQYLDCLEKHYLVDCDKSVYKEALEEVVDYVVNDVLMQGFITKKGHMVKSTKNRWFVLKPGHLQYFTNRSCTDKKGEIAINSSTKVAGVPDNKKWRFTIACGETKTHYDLEVKDQRAKQEWIVAIQKAIASSGGQSVQRKERLQRRLDRNEKKLAKLEEERRKQEQENLLLAQQKELESLRQKYSDAEAQALIEAENLQDEIKRREELEKLHQELQGLLLTEKEAREAEANARALQEELLLNEKKRLEEMERMKAEKESLLQEELKKRESLEERQKLQDKLLEEERQRLEELERERQAAEQAMKEANDKLLAAEEASRKAAEEAKKKAREITTCTGLARPVGPHVPSYITHRGVGAFCEDDFAKLKKVKKAPPIVKPKPKRNAVDSENVTNEEDSHEEEREGQTVDGGEVEENGHSDKDGYGEEGREEKEEEKEGEKGENVHGTEVEKTQEENHDQEIVASGETASQPEHIPASHEENNTEEENKASEETSPNDSKTEAAQEEVANDETTNNQRNEDEKIENTNKDTTNETPGVVDDKLDNPELNTQGTNNQDANEVSDDTKLSDETVSEESHTENST